MKPHLTIKSVVLAVLAGATALCWSLPPPRDAPAAPGWNAEDKARWTLLNQQAADLYERGDQNGASVAAQKAVEQAETKVGPAHPDVAASLNLLASIYIRQSALDKATALFQRSLTIMEKALGPDDPGLSAYQSPDRGIPKAGSWVIRHWRSGLRR